MTHYDSEFYQGQKDISRQSASHLVPLLIKHLSPTSVADVGCGVGTWLSVFKENGVANVLGLDGDYVDRSQLLVDADEFRPSDLTQIQEVGKQFDLAISLEVGEHIPTEHSEVFVDNITSLSDLIVFSAAIPGQGGTNHINEQWVSWWAKHFEAKGYEVVDCLRPLIWEEEGIAYYYRQNVVCYVKSDNTALMDKVRQLPVSNMPLDVVHPETLTDSAKELTNVRHKLTRQQNDFWVAYEVFRNSLSQQVKRKLGSK